MTVGDWAPSLLYRIFQILSRALHLLNQVPQADSVDVTVTTVARDFDTDAASNTSGKPAIPILGRFPDVGSVAVCSNHTSAPHKPPLLAAEDSG